MACENIPYLIVFGLLLLAVIGIVGLAIWGK